MWTGLGAARLVRPERRRPATFDTGLVRGAMERETGFEPATFSLEG